MKLLQDHASPLPKMLKDQHLREGESYRLMRYVVRQPVEEGLILYNVLTKAVALLTREEARKVDECPNGSPYQPAMMTVSSYARSGPSQKSWGNLSVP